MVDEVKNSITREGIDKTFSDLGVGIAITDIRSNQTGAAHTIYTTYDHGLNGIFELSVVTAGSGYGPSSGTAGEYYNTALGFSTTGANACLLYTSDAADEV